jgi:hypothetical protein
MKLGKNTSQLTGGFRISNAARLGVTSTKLLHICSLNGIGRISRQNQAKHAPSLEMLSLRTNKAFECFFHLNSVILGSEILLVIEKPMELLMLGFGYDIEGTSSELLPGEGEVVRKVLEIKSHVQL